jgi:acylphosphatase
MTDSDEALRIVVHGRVQGVFFRDTCRREAQRLGVRGWVRNRDDGTVEAVLAGRPHALKQMVRWAQDGPPHAVVETVEAEPADDPGTAGFEVR